MGKIHVGHMRKFPTQNPHSSKLAIVITGIPIVVAEL